MQHLFSLNSHRRSIKLSPPFPGQEPGDVPPIPIPPYPQQSPLGRKAEPCLWVFRWARLAASRGLRPFIPITGFISKSRNRPFEQIRRNQRHHGKVLFTTPSCSVPFIRLLRSLLFRSIHPSFVLPSSPLPSGFPPFGDHNLTPSCAYFPAKKLRTVQIHLKIPVSRRSKKRD